MTTTRAPAGFLCLGLLCLLPRAAAAELAIGMPAPGVELSGELGGTLDGESWSSETLHGALHLLYYVDPDHPRMNHRLNQALAAERFDPELLRSVAIINIKATMLPKFLIRRGLRGKQKEFPHTTYVQDLGKVLVDAWGLVDHTHNILLFDREGRLVFRGDGEFSDDQLRELLQKIHELLGRL